MVATIAYFPYGGTRSTSGGLNTDEKFTGQRLDQDGLYYYGARYYDPGIGRFISADPIVPQWTNPQSLNRYSYCYNNPLVFVDPTGHLSIRKWCSNRVDDVKETVSDATNAIRSYMGMMTPTPDPAAYIRGKENGDTVGMIDALTGGASADSAGLLNALGSTLVSQGTEDNVAAAYASGDQGSLTRAVGFAAAEATINVGVTLFGGAITGAVVGKVAGRVGAIASRNIALRLRYEGMVTGLRDVAAGMESRGISQQVMAQTLNQSRRALGVEYKGMTPWAVRQVIYLRNGLRYHDRLGPTMSYFSRHHYSYAQIIDSACTPGGNDLGFWLLR